MDRYQDRSVRDPPAFSRFNANTGPFPEDAVDRQSNKRVSVAINQFERANKKRRDQAVASTTFADGHGFTGEAKVGKRGREKAQRQARETERKLEEDDEPDWFAEHNTARRGRLSGTGSSAREESRRNGDGSSKRRKERQSLALAQEEVAGWFTDKFTLPFSGPEESQNEHEEREFLRYQQNQGGRFRASDQDFEFPERETDRYRGKDRERDRRRNPDHRGARDRHDRPREGQPSRVPPISIKGASSSSLRNGDSRSTDKVSWKEQDLAPWNRDARETSNRNNNGPTNDHRSHGHRSEPRDASSSRYGPRYGGGYGI